MVIPFLFLAGVVVVIVLAVRRDGARKRARRASLDATLQRLAPVIAGTIDKDDVLDGSYRGLPVRVRLGRMNPFFASSSRPEQDVEVLHVHLGGIPGGAPWQFHADPELLGHHQKGWRYRPEATPVGNLMSRWLDVQKGSWDLETPLRDAGIPAVLDRLATDSRNFLPVVRHLGNAGTTLASRAMAAGVAERLGPAAGAPRPGPLDGFQVDLQRFGAADPSAERFQEVLEILILIGQMNHAVNPPRS